MQPESAESNWFYEALAWLEFNRKRVIVGAGVLLAAIIAVYVYDWHQGQKEAEANGALFALKGMTKPTAEEASASALDLLKVARDHPETTAAERALLLAAGALFDQGKYAEAQTQFEAFLSRYGRGSLAPIAALGVAASLDSQDKVDAAMSAYQRVANQYPAEPVAARARLNTAILHESRNQSEQALRLYQELSKPGAVGGVAMDAAGRRQRLLQRHPELTPTNAPAKPTPSRVTLVPTPTNASGTGTLQAPRPARPPTGGQ
jgi:predicted negative regulator of RcsB-dependent stress response